MDNSKVLKPIIGPQESAESKKKESNKKKKALIVSALAFLIATGTIATSIAVVKANMPKLEIKFDDWFVESFDFDSMQNFIDENRLSKGEIDKKLPGYVDKKAKDQNVKNADMITNARLTNKIPEDKNNKLPKGIYVEMTAELDYAFAYQADLSLEENPDQETKELSNITEQPKKPRYFINSDKSKLYVLVYERKTDSDEATEEDLQTFNDYHITNTIQAFNKLDEYIAQQSRRYTFEEFSSNKNNYEPGLDIFYDTLIGLEKQYIKKDSVRFEEENGQHVIKIEIDSRRSNFYFENGNNNVEYTQDPNNPKIGILSIKGLSYFNETLLNLDTLQEDIQNYIKEFDPDNNIDRRYTLDEFRSQFNDQTLKETILNALGLIPKSPNPFANTDVDTDPDNPDTPEVPEEPIPPVVDTSKIKNMYIDNTKDKNLVIELTCDKNQKYKAPADMDATKYQFDQINDRIIVKGLRYYTEYKVTHTDQAYHNLDSEIIRVPNEYTVAEFQAQAEGSDTQQKYIDLIAKGLRANGGTFNSDLIKTLAVTPNPNSDTLATLKITFDDDFKKYKTNDNEQYKIDHTKSTLDIPLTFFKQVEINNLQSDIQWIIKSQDGPQYTVEEFQKYINEDAGESSTTLKDKITDLVTTSVQGATNVDNFSYDRDNNELKFQVTIQKYEKFPSEGQNVKYVLNKKNEDGTTVYDITVSNLLYWYDFKISIDELKRIKQEVGDFILNNGICSSTDPDENNYPDFKEQIYNLFGQTTLENGWKLSNFMTYDEQNFKLINDNEFLINLKPKLDQSGSYFKNYLRNFEQVTGLPNDVGIEMPESDKILKFKNMEFSTTKAFFIIDETKKRVLGVNEKGRLQKTLKIPAGYPTINTQDITINGKKIRGWSEVTNVENFYMTDTVKEITSGYFLYKANNLKYLKISKSLNVNNSDAFVRLPKLTTVDLKNSKDADLMMDRASRSWSYLDSLDHLLFTKNTTKVADSGITNNKNLEYIICWFQTDNSNFGYPFTQNPKLESIILLANDFNPRSTYKAPLMSAYNNKNLKFYITNQELKQKMISKKQEYFNTTDEDDVVEERIVVIPDLEQQLKNLGHIPADW